MRILNEEEIIFAFYLLKIEEINNNKGAINKINIEMETCKLSCCTKALFAKVSGTKNPVTMTAKDNNLTIPYSPF
jgi:hypothetical protein